MDASLTRLTQTGDLTAANLLVARLQAEGVDAIVRGEPLGPYPVTVGRMAVTEILVPAEQLEEAEELLGEIEAEMAGADVEPGGLGRSPDLSRSVLLWIVSVVILTFVVWSWLIRFL